MLCVQGNKFGNVKSVSIGNIIKGIVKVKVYKLRKKEFSLVILVWGTHKIRYKKSLSCVNHKKILNSAKQT